HATQLEHEVVTPRRELDLGVGSRPVGPAGGGDEDLDDLVLPELVGRARRRWWRRIAVQRGDDEDVQRERVATQADADAFALARGLAVPEVSDGEVDAVRISGRRGRRARHAVVLAVALAAVGIAARVGAQGTMPPMSMPGHEHHPEPAASP